MNSQAESTNSKNGHTAGQQGGRSTWRRIADSRFANAMAAPHGMGRYLEAVNPMWALDQQRVRVRVVSKQQETADAVTLTLKTNGEWTGFKPGQFVQLNVEVNGRQLSRCYSLSSSDTGRYITLTIKAQADGWVSKYINEQLSVGDLLTISPAMGEFVLPDQLPDELLFIAGGSGITPLKCMLESLLKNGYQGQLALLYYNRSEADAIFHRELQQLENGYANFRLLKVYENNTCGELAGYFDSQHLAMVADLVTDGHLPLSYVCGPAGLMDSVQAVYARAGQSAQLHSERFSSPVQIPANADEVHGELRFTKSERYVENDGRNLLDQAEAIGLTPEAGCRMGLCHTCTCTKTAGTVRNIETGELSHGEEEIRICVSQAVGDVTLDI